MEITEPVILDIPQGRKAVRLEIKTRADARDLIAVIARRMLDLPDDGDGGVLFAADDEAADEGGPMDDEAELRRAEEIRAGWKPTLESLREQVARLSEPAEPEAPMRLLSADEADAAESIVYLACGDQLDGDWQTGATIASDLPVGSPLQCPRHGTTVILTVNEYMDRASSHPNDPGPLASVTRLVTVTRIVDGEPVEVQPCPRRHPETRFPCLGLAGHEPPCRGVDGDEWVPAGEAVTA